MNLKEITLVSLALGLVIASLLSTPSVDKIQLANSQEYPLFYATTVPIVYYMATAYLALLALFSKARIIKLLSITLLALLIEFTPTLMLANPWLPDQYPYLSEAVWLTRNSHITEFHHLGETPGLGLMFSQLMLITGLGPFDVSKIYPLLIVLVVPLLFLAGEKVCGDGLLASMLFLGFAYFPAPVYHRSTYFSLLLVVLMFLLVKSLSGKKVGYAVAYILTLSAIVISYPGIIVLIIALGAAVFMFYLLYGKSHKLLTLSIPLVSVVIFLSWQVYVAKGEFRYMVASIYHGLQELTIPMESILLETSAYKGASGFTEIYQTILNMRIGFMLLLLALAITVAVYSLLKGREKHNLLFTSLIYLGLIVQFLPLSLIVYRGPWFAMKFEALFVYFSVMCIAALPTLKFVGKHGNRVKQALTCLAVASLLLVPLLSYPGIPYLHTPSSELKAKIFIDSHYDRKEPILATEMNLPYLLFRVLLDKDPTWELTAVLSPEEPIRYDSSYLTLQRFMTRDGYFIRSVSYENYLTTLTESLQASHNLVYDGGIYTELFIAP